MYLYVQIQILTFVTNIELMTFSKKKPIKKAEAISRLLPDYSVLITSTVYYT